MASRDFLVAFGGRRGEGAPPDDEAGGGSDDIELSLGLSLGGRFGTEAKRQRLVRSSSIASVCSISSMDGDRDDDPVPAAPLPLLRTSSLPTEVEEERWRRREMQSHRRLEARRKRVERRKSMVSSSSSGQAKSGDDAPDGGNGFQPRRSTGSQGSSSVNATEQGLAGSAIVHSTDASTLASDNNTKQSNVLPPPTSTGKLVNVRRIDHEEIELVAIATNSISKSLDKDSPQLNRLGGLLGYLLVYKEGLLSHRVDTEKKHENIEREREKS